MGSNKRQLCNENLEAGDLKRLIEPTITIDEYKSKMGNDEDICVIKFEVRDESPGGDLVSFIEKGYEWVLDAECAEGEELDGNYQVFVEADRGPELLRNLVEMVRDITNLTEQSIDEWEFSYYKDKTRYPLTLTELKNHVPLTPKEYQAKYDTGPEEDSDGSMDQLRAAAGVKTNTKAPVNDLTESLRRAAGLR